MSLTIGSVCSGYGGLDMAVHAVFGGELAWWSDIDEGAIRIMTHHHPGVPNLGDFTALDWADVPSVDILTAGFPCQPFSLAGQRAGEEDERHLWPYIVEAIRALRPKVVVLENVAGLRSAGGVFDVPTIRCVCGWSGRRGRVHLREGRADVRRDQSDDRHVNEGAERAGVDVRAVRRNADHAGACESDSLSDHNLDGQRSRGGSIPASDRVASDLEVGASPGGSEDRGDPHVAGADRESRSLSLDLGIAESMQGASSTPERAERSWSRLIGDADRGDAVCPSCGRSVGYSADGSVFRSGLGTVFRDLASLGLRVRFVSVRASDTGACHGRERFIMLAYAEGESWVEQYGAALAAADTEDVGCEWGGRTREQWARPADSRLLPTPTARDHKGHNQRRDDTCLTGALLPTPRATDHHDSLTAPAARQHVLDGNGTLTETLGMHLFPTPRASDGEKGGPGQRGSSGDLMLPSAVALLPTPSVADSQGGHESRSGARGDELLLPGVAKSLALLPTPTATSYGSNQSASDGAAVRRSLEYVTDWGKYATAIRRHEIAFGRPAPSPVQPSSKGTPQLAPVFTEWMMGLPLGWVTDPAIWAGMLNAKGKPASKAAIRNAQLHALGNGVVPQQAIYALRVMLSWRLAIRGAA